jgi:hypothetical protein
MRFLVSRTRDYSLDGPPCEEAFRGTYTVVDQRTVDDPAKLRAAEMTERWYREGENHRVIDRQITRDFPGWKGWFVEIPDLDALLAFIAKYGELVIGPHHRSDELFIEIYDGYRE